MQNLKGLKGDESGFELIITLIGLAIVTVGVLILWALNMLIWVAVGGLFAVGGVFLLQITPAKGWIGVIIGTILIIAAIAIGIYA